MFVPFTIPYYSLCLLTIFSGYTLIDLMYTRRLYATLGRSLWFLLTHKSPADESYTEYAYRKEDLYSRTDRITPVNQMKMEREAELTLILIRFGLQRPCS